MKTLEMAEATAPLIKYAQGLKREPVILTENGKPVAALVAIKNADLETITLSSHPEFLALIESSRARHLKEGGISSTEMRRRLKSK